MSYILDALKKSEQERQQGASPNLYTMHTTSPSGRKFSTRQRRRILLWLGGAIALLLIFLGILWFMSRPGETPPPPAVPEKTSEPKETPELNPAPSEQPVHHPVQIEEKTAAEAPVVQENASRPEEPVPQVIIREKKLTPQPLVRQQRTIAATPVKTRDDAGSRLPLLRDLPPALQAEIPEMKFAGHTYSDNPSQRMIIVNGQILREGSTIAAGTRLEQITWDGVIIDFRSTRFLVKLN